MCFAYALKGLCRQYLFKTEELWMLSTHFLSFTYAFTRSDYYYIHSDNRAYLKNLKWGDSEKNITKH